MPLTPAVLEAAEAFRARLLQRERRAATALVRYYGEAWRRLQSDILALESEILTLRSQGFEPTREIVIDLQRMRAIQYQVEQEMQRFVEFAESEVAARQREALAAGERDAYELMQLSFPESAGVRIDFYRMPREAVEAYVGMLEDGTPLRALLRQYVDGAAQEMSETLVTGMVAGWNPRKVAREIRHKFGMGLTESLRLARTEQLRAYREATRQSYAANDNVVKGWRRLAAKDTRTCAACLMLDGTEYAVGEPMDDHPNGRCAMVPITKTYAELGIDAPEPQYTPESGREWFERQDEATQRAILGDGRYEAWQDGRFQLEDLPHRHHDPVWGDSWTPTPLYELLGESAPVGSYAVWVEGQGEREAVTP